jgi:hypothetical protein
MLTANSSAVLQFQPKPQQQPQPEPLGFVQASKAWLAYSQEHPNLKDIHKSICTQMFLKFNTKHFEATGELLAWPSWEYLMAKTGRSKSTVYRKLEDIEREGLLEISHGLYNQETKKRDRNEYKARLTKVSPVQPWSAEQGVNSVPDQGVKFRRNQGVSADTIRSDSIRSDSKEANLSEKGFCFSESQSEESKGQARTAPSVPKEAKPAEDSKAARTPSRPSASSAATPSPSTSPSTPNPLVPRAPLPAAQGGVPAELPPEVKAVVRTAIAGHRISPAVNMKLYHPSGRAPPASPPDCRVVKTRDEMDLVDDFCLSMRL